MGKEGEVKIIDIKTREGKKTSANPNESKGEEEIDPEEIEKTRKGIYKARQESGKSTLKKR